jgi:hypothetical protein
MIGQKKRFGSLAEVLAVSLQEVTPKAYTAFPRLRWLRRMA